MFVCSSACVLIRPANNRPPVQVLPTTLDDGLFELSRLMCNFYINGTVLLTPHSTQLHSHYSVFSHEITVHQTVTLMSNSSLNGSLVEHFLTKKDDVTLYNKHVFNEHISFIICRVNYVHIAWLSSIAF